MAGGSGKVEKGAEDLGAAEKNPGMGGGQTEGIRDVLQGVSTGGVFFGSGKWVLTPRIGRALGIFQHRVARRITGRQVRRRMEGRW